MNTELLFNISNTVLTVKVIPVCDNTKWVMLIIKSIIKLFFLLLSNKNEERMGQHEDLNILGQIKVWVRKGNDI